VCLRELDDAGMMNIQLDNLNDEMEKILQLLRHLSERYLCFTHQLCSLAGSHRLNMKAILDNFFS
jgi:hypothetical protein